MKKLKSQLEHVDRLKFTHMCQLADHFWRLEEIAYATPLARRLEGKTSEGIAHGTGPFLDIVSLTRLIRRQSLYLPK